MDTLTEPRTHDLTGSDYVTNVADDGGRGPDGVPTVKLFAWTGRKPQIGDFVLLRNGRTGSSSRYWISAILLPLDPPDMWIADLRFAPR